MKRLLLGLLGVAAVACQPPAATTVAATPVTTTAPATAPTPAPAPAASLPVAGVTLAPPQAAPAGMSAAMRAFARRHDLSGMWQGLTEADTTGALAPAVCDGFFGPDHYHIALVLLRVARDTADPLLYHVRGKDLYKHRVTAFTGTIRLRQLRAIATRKATFELLEGKFRKFYTALGEFSWQETGPTGAGTFSGTLGIDFTQQGDSSLASTCFQDNGTRQQFAHGGRMYLAGKWVARQAGPPKQLLASATLETIGQAVFADFNVGERSFEINPKYARLGWNEYWRNDEWWADTPSPTLSL